MEERQEEYARYIKRIVRSDLDGYARIAYEPEESDLAKRLLKTVCQFYTAGVEAHDEVGQFSFRTKNSSRSLDDVFLSLG